jgi:hypothetical protein
MRYLLILLLLFAGLSSNAQSSNKELPSLPYDSATKKISYFGVVNIDSTSKEELYTRAKLWFATTYNSANAVIQMDDKESGIIVGKATMKVGYYALGTYYHAGYIDYLITIKTKDNKYRYEITNFVHDAKLAQQSEFPSGGTAESMTHTSVRVMGFSYQKTFNQLLYEMNNNANSLVASIKKGMETSVTKKGDW